MLCTRLILITLICAIPASGAIARTIYVDSKYGDDVDPGTKQKPLRSLSKAAQIVNSKTQSGPATIKIQPGIYSLEKSVVFDRADRFTEKQRLIIEASILPDDPNWTPASMPVILSTENPGISEKLTETYSLKIKRSYVTIRGLKFLGNLVIILRAIGGDLNPSDIFAPCSLNARLTPLRNRLRIISNTLKAFCDGGEKRKDIDSDILALLGAKTDQKLWLAASLDKTIRLHQGL